MRRLDRLVVRRADWRCVVDPILRSFYSGRSDRVKPGKVQIANMLSSRVLIAQKQTAQNQAAAY
jgi:hypothetical protein